MRLCIILHPQTMLTTDPDYVRLSLAGAPGVLIPLTMINSIVTRVANPGCQIIRLPAGHVFGPEFPGRDRGLMNEMLKSYMYFGRDGDRKTIFFIPKPYVLYIDYGE